MKDIGDDIYITIKDGGFIEFEERNGKSLLRQIQAVNVTPSRYVYVYHGNGDASVKYEFRTMEKANGFLDILYEACVDLDRIKSDPETNQITRVRQYSYA